MESRLGAKHLFFGSISNCNYEIEITKRYRITMLIAIYLQCPLKLLCDYIDKLYELLKNLNSALDHDNVEIRMFSQHLPETS